MKQQTIASKTMAMKARVFNELRTALYGQIKYRNRHIGIKYKQITELSDEEKIEIYDRMLLSLLESHWELNDYKAKRKEKARIQMLREERKKKVA